MVLRALFVTECNSWRCGAGIPFACDRCYVYRAGDQGWRNQPSAITAEATARGRWVMLTPAPRLLLAWYHFGLSVQSRIILSRYSPSVMRSARGGNPGREDCQAGQAGHELAAGLREAVRQQDDQALGVLGEQGPDDGHGGQARFSGH